MDRGAASGGVGRKSMMPCHQPRTPATKTSERADSAHAESPIFIKASIRMNNQSAIHASGVVVLRRRSVITAASTGNGTRSGISEKAIATCRAVRVRSQINASWRKGAASPCGNARSAIVLAFPQVPQCISPAKRMPEQVGQRVLDLVFRCFMAQAATGRSCAWVAA